MLYVLVFLLVCQGASGAAGITTSRGMQQRAAAWACKVDTQFACAADKCQDRQASLTVTIDFRKRTYTRCVLSVCETYKFTYEQWGEYSVIHFDRKGGAYAIAVNDGREFTESVSQGMWTLSGFGSCIPRRK